MDRIMQKCHCSNVCFEEIVRVACETGKDFRNVMAEMGAGQICTACVEDLYLYCERRLSSNTEMPLPARLAEIQTV